MTNDQSNGTSEPLSSNFKLNLEGKGFIINTNSLISSNRNQGPINSPLGIIKVNDQFKDEYHLNDPSNQKVHFFNQTNSSNTNEHLPVNLSPQLLSNNLHTSEFHIDDNMSSNRDKFETSKQTCNLREDSISNHLHT